MFRLKKQKVQAEKSDDCVSFSSPGFSALVINILGEIVLLDPAHITAVPKHFTLLSLAHKKYKPVFI